MDWYCAKINGSQKLAAFYLERAGLKPFYPTIYRYFTDRRTGEERYRVVSLFPGYIFIPLADAAERDRATRAIGVAYLLGNWTGDRFAPRQMPSEWIASLIEAGPIIEGKRVAFRRGDTVRVAVAGIGKAICQIEAIDNSHSAIVSMAMFGAVRRVSVAMENLEPARTLDSDTSGSVLPSRNARRRAAKQSAKLSPKSHIKAAANG